MGDWVDDGQYLVSARSLCDLSGYRLPSRPGDPVATKYPIGTSALTALLLAILPGKPSTEHDWLAGRILVIASGATLVLVCRKFFLRSGLSDWTASLMALGVIWYPTMIHLTATLMSDVPYAAVSVLLVVRWIKRSQLEAVRSRDWLIDGLLGGGAWLIRGNGITLVIAAVVAAVSGDRSRRSRVGAVLAVLAGVALLKLPASLYLSAISGPRDTGNYLTEQLAAFEASGHLWSIPWANLSRLPGLLFSTLFAPTILTKRVIQVLARWPILGWAGCLFALGIFSVGLMTLIRRKTWPAPVWVHAGLTLLIYIGWHFPIDFRFTLPLIPLTLTACVFGVERLANRRGITLLFCAGLLASSILVVSGMIWRAYPHSGVMRDRNSASQLALFEIISSRTPDNSVIICSVPEFFYLNTGRQAAPMKDDATSVGGKPASWSRLRYWFRLAEDRPIYFLTDEVGGVKVDDIADLCNEGRLHLDPVGATPAGRLWHVERTDGSPP